MTTIEKRINRMSNDWGVKAVAFVLLTLSFLALFFLVMATYKLDALKAYSVSRSEFIKEGLRPIAEEDYLKAYRLFNQGNTLEFEEYFSERNADILIYRFGELVYGTEEENSGGWSYDFFPWGTSDLNMMQIRVSSELTYDDSYRLAYRNYEFAYTNRYMAPILAWVFGLLYMVFQIFIVCSAGKKDENGQLSETIVAMIPTDLLIIFNCLVAYAGIRFIIFVAESIDSLRVSMSLQAVTGMIIILFTTLILMEFSIRLKLGTWYRSSLVMKWGMGLGALLKTIGITIVDIIKALPALGQAFLVAAVCSLVEFIGLLMFRDDFMLYWVICKILTTMLLVFLIYNWKKVGKGISQLAGGDLKTKISLKGLPSGTRKVAEELNRLGDVVSNAVEDRTRSEKLKTELITNVSHDIKTPVTSIVNYSDLMGVEITRAANGEEPHWDRLLEYSDVLLRQSGKLKKLVEDLVEASKATSGNIEIELAPCAIGVLVSQAVSEYESRFERKGLELVIRQPEEELIVPADGRHIWRVIDNLLSNIHKYAMENSRVYITVESNDDTVDITFKNMSKYALDVSPEELKERFVRGDSSRNMEGHGLGLSIAQTLMELQGGSLDVLTDGDLFKAVIKLRKYAGEEATHDQ